MTKRTLVFLAMLLVLLFGVATVAQEPVVNIDAKVHPNLAEAQRHIVEAYKAVVDAQKANKYDMKGHAAKAGRLLVEADNELKAAAAAANAAGATKKK
jgi:hypothetical protein